MRARQEAAELERTARHACFRGASRDVSDLNTWRLNLCAAHRYRDHRMSRTEQDALITRCRARVGQTLGGKWTLTGLIGAGLIAVSLWWSVRQKRRLTRALAAAMHVEGG